MAEVIEGATDFLRELLGAGPIATNTVRTQAKAAHFSWATIRRAKDRLSVVSVRRSKDASGAGEWFWHLPQDAQTARVQGAQTQRLQEAQTQEVHRGQDAQNENRARCVQDAHAAPQRRRVITVRQQPHGPDEISYEEWEELGRELGSNCQEVAEFIRRRDAQVAANAQG